MQHVLVFTVGLFFLLPFLWMLSTALKSDLDIYRTPQTWLPYDLKQVEIDGELLPLYNVQIDDTTKELAALEIKKGQGKFVDPANPEAIIEVRMTYAEPILIVKPRWQNFPDAMSKRYARRVRIKKGDCVNVQKDEFLFCRRGIGRKSNC